MSNVTTANIRDASASADFGARLHSASHSSWSVPNWQVLISATMRLADAFLIGLAGLLSFSLRANDVSQHATYLLQVTLAILLAAIYFQHMGLYRFSNLHKFASQLPKLAVAYSAVACTLIVLDYFLKISGQISRVWSVAWFVFALTLLLLVRLAIWRWVGSLRQAGKFAASVAIVGSQDSARRLIARMGAQLGQTVNLVGIVEAEGEVAGMFEELARVSRKGRVDEVLIPLPWTNATPLEALLRTLRNLPLNVRLVPELPKTTFSRPSFTDRCGVPAISVVEQPLTGMQTAIKRVEDIAISLIGLVLASPLMLLIALLIKLDSPGPALFVQDRWGFNARRIPVRKFRTMRVDTGDDPAVTQATRDDARVTRIGRLLRRTSLDELPQLINVLRGDMSLVGPRPHAVAHNERYVALIDNYLGRHRVKPGITGLAQINGCRGITDTIDKMEQRVAYDLLYIETWSLFLDLKVMFLTIFVGFANPNAF